MTNESKQQLVATTLVENATDAEREELFYWASELLAIRNSTLPARKKALLALKATSSREILWPLIKRAYKKLKKVLWSDRGWWFRIGGGGILLAAGTVAGKSLGVATMGFGAGIPLWIVFGGGGIFAGLIVEKLANEFGAPQTTYSVIEKELNRKKDS